MIYRNIGAAYCKNVACSFFDVFEKKNFTLTKYNKLMKNIEIEFKKFKMKLIVLVDFLKIRWYVDSCNKNFNKFNTDINMIFIVTKKKIKN